MTTATATNYLEIVEHLVPGVPAIFHDVSWDEYELLVEELWGIRSVQISYDKGAMELMAISAEHDYFGLCLHNLIRFATFRLKIQLRSFGHATMKKSKVLAGKEPDGCYYVKSLRLIGSRIQLDFEHDPPPDIALEIDLSTNTIPKLPIYQRLGVAEVWLYDGDEITIYRLGALGYESIPQSQELPCFTSKLLTEFLRDSESPDDDNQLLEDYVERIVQAQPSA